MTCRTISACVAVVLSLSSLTRGQTCYEGERWPEDERWIYRQNYPQKPTKRELRDGWLVQPIEPMCDPPEMNCGKRDSYLGNLLAYEGENTFVEWRMITDCPDEDVNHHNGCALMVLVGGPVSFHFNIASGLGRLIRGPQYEQIYFEIEHKKPHTYRLEVQGGDWFEFFIDGEMVVADVPEDVFPTNDALISFGARYHLSGHTTEWDYVKFGILTEPGEGKCDPNDEVDMRDYRRVERCLRTGGPDSFIWRPICLFYDYDKDNDIDLRDVAAFQNAFTGSKE